MEILVLEVIGCHTQWLKEELSVELHNEDAISKLLPERSYKLLRSQASSWINSKMSMHSKSTDILINVGFKAIGMSKHHGSIRKEVLVGLTELIRQKGWRRKAEVLSPPKNQEQLEGICSL